MSAISPSQFPLRALSVRQFMAAYGLSRQTTYNLLSSGEIQSRLCGRRRMFLADSAEAWLLKKDSANAQK